MLYPEVKGPVFLVGFSGVGKSTVGRELATLLGRHYVDTDLFIAKKYHSSVPEMITCCGIDKFRKREKVVLIELSRYSDIVVATGGGLACEEGLMEIMNARGQTVYLTSEEEALAERLFLVRSSRPLVADKSLEEVRHYIRETLPVRAPYYEKAKYRVDATRLKDTQDAIRIAKEIVHLLS